MSQFCTSCGQEISAMGAYCGACGTKRTMQAAVTASVQEQEFFSDSLRGILVTNARFLTGTGKTYAMAGITSVSLAQTPDRRGWPTLFLLITLTAAAIGARSAGTIFAAACVSGFFVTWITACAPRWVIRLFTSGGQAEEVESKDRAFIERIIAGLNQAIIARGRLAV